MSSFHASYCRHWHSPDFCFRPNPEKKSRLDLQCSCLILFLCCSWRKTCLPRLNLLRLLVSLSADRLFWVRNYFERGHLNEWLAVAMIWRDFDVTATWQFIVRYIFKSVYLMKFKTAVLCQIEQIPRLRQRSILFNGFLIVTFFGLATAPNSFLMYFGV